MARLGYTILYVQDVAKTISFYETVFDCKQKFVTPENDYGELVTGETTLSFASFALAQSNFDEPIIFSEISKAPLGFEIAFVVENVDETYHKSLENGASSLAKPKQKPWGQVVAYIRDINGFVVEICTAMS